MEHTLTRQPCEECGAKNAMAHHDDYTKPLQVRWLCRKHHRLFHIGISDAQLPGYESREDAHALVAAALLRGEGRKLLSYVASREHVQGVTALAARDGRTIAGQVRWIVARHLESEGMS
jgi:ribosomal protein S27AE